MSQTESGAVGIGPETADPVAVVAVDGAIPPKVLRQAKGQIPDGHRAHVELTAHLKGMVTRGEPSEAAPTANLLNKAMVGELLRRLGVTREAALKHMRAIAEEALIDGQVNIGQAFSDANPQLLTAIKQVEDEVIAKLPKQPRAGRLSIQCGMRLSDVAIEQ